MIVSVEISLYPLSENFEKPIDAFSSLVSVNPNLSIDSGKMSSVITGELSEIMKTLNNSMGVIFDQFPAVFNLKISNCCPV